ncbi:MAG: DUF3617 family protein [Pseudomonadota bacterium]
MKPIFLVAIALVAAPISASADTITLPPGLWNYDGTATLGLAELRESGEECMQAGQSTYDLNKVARSIAPGCELAAATSTGDGVTFSIACTGDVKGELEGEFSFTQDAAALEAMGWTGTPDARVPLEVTATATRVAETCQ